MPNSFLNPWRLAGVVTAALVAFPFLALLVIALSGSTDSLAHITRYVLPRTVAPTLLLMGGVALITALVGTVTAFIIVFYEFPLRRALGWLLLLPLAVPSYIAAYGFVEFLSFTGPLQSLLRDLIGASSARDYWFPDVRSVGGAVLVLSLTLYPYVYLTVRASFSVQGINLIEAARMAGASPLRVFVRVALPLARPAIAVGVVLALMETLNDIGAVEHLGVQTLTFAVFSTWLNQGDMAGAAQLALLLFVIVLFLIHLERRARRSGVGGKQKMRGSVYTTRHRRPLPGASAWLAMGVCALPILLGFLLPISVLAAYALRRLSGLADPALWQAMVTTLALASVAALLAGAIAVLLCYGLRVAGSRSLRLLTRLAAAGYAIPGTVVALGIFIPLARLDNLINGWTTGWFGFGLGLVLTGSGVTLIYAYLVRFLAMAEGNLASGFERISASVDHAARVLGRTRSTILIYVMLPLLRPAIGAAILLVFIDVTKELSATILLRPFGLSTLSTYIYEYASMGRIEDAAVACLIMVAVAILPIALLLRRAMQ